MLKLQFYTFISLVGFLMAFSKNFKLTLKQLVLLEDTGVHRENHRLSASH